jgi:hypothetical protein
LHDGRRGSRDDVGHLIGKSIEHQFACHAAIVAESAPVHITRMGRRRLRLDVFERPS